MNMLMIVFRESLEEDINGMLSKHHVRAFTAMHDVTGMGEAGAAFHSLSWPGLNNMFLVALPAPEADKVVAELKGFRDRQIEKQGGAKKSAVGVFPAVRVGGVTRPLSTAGSL